MSIWDNVKALTFDFYGTLFDWEYSIRHESEKVLRKHGSMVDVDHFIRYWRSQQLHYSMVNTLIDRGRKSFLDLTWLALRHSLKTYDIHYDESEMKSLLARWTSLRPFPEIKESLKILRTKYMVVIASNGDKDVLTRNSELYDLSFDHIFSSEIANAYKPSRIFYEKLLQLLDLKPDQVMHIARSQFDVFGSKAVGLHATWINRGHETLTEGFYKPDFQVNDLRELATIAL